MYLETASTNCFPSALADLSLDQAKRIKSNKQIHLYRKNKYRNLRVEDTSTMVVDVLIFSFFFFFVYCLNSWSVSCCLLFLSHNIMFTYCYFPSFILFYHTHINYEPKYMLECVLKLIFRANIFRNTKKTNRKSEVFNLQCVGIIYMGFLSVFLFYELFTIFTK